MLKILQILSATILFSVSGYASDNKNEAEAPVVSYSIAKFSISDFSFKNIGGKILISWFSNEGSQIETIELEKADYTEKFETLQEMRGFSSSRALKYNSVDLNPITGQNNYRLKIITKNGSISYTNTISASYREIKTKKTPENKIGDQPKTDKYGLSNAKLFNPALSVSKA
ncbi:MAG: hypothetical protein ACJARG_001556 [Arcticibacterium sp.]|jgi:hypothetical protein